MSEQRLAARPSLPTAEAIRKMGTGPKQFGYCALFQRDSRFVRLACDTA